MSINNLKPTKGSKKDKTRKGRGNASGKGGESGRGHKGQKSRSGYSKRAGFEGGQNPLYIRLPKLKGFKPRKRVIYDIINLDLLNSLFSDGDTVDIDSLAKKGILFPSNKIKILSNGELDKKLSISAHKFSKNAIKLIEKYNGSVTYL
jgi:large subunit ribosomal protein L15